MRRHNLLPVLSLALFIAYSVIVTATSGAASFAASPLVIGVIAAMIWHDRVAEAA